MPQSQGTTEWAWGWSAGDQPSLALLPFPDAYSRSPLTGQFLLPCRDLLKREM